MQWLEEFYTWKQFGMRDAYGMPAKTVDAFFVLEKELVEETNNAQK
jgi:hypothetical protein